MGAGNPDRPVICPKAYGSDGKARGFANKVICDPSYPCYDRAKTIDAAVQGGSFIPSKLGEHCRKRPSMLPHCPKP